MAKVPRNQPPGGVESDEGRARRRAFGRFGGRSGPGAGRGNDFESPEDRGRGGPGKRGRRGHAPPPSKPPPRQYGPRPGVSLLRDMPPGCRGTIRRLSCKGRLRRRLMDMGMVPGATVEVENPAPLGDPMKLRLKGCHLSLRREEAGQIEVDIENEE